MKFRNKILLYFSTTSIVLVGILFLALYWLSAEYREEEFQQRQREKILYTLQFITDVAENEYKLIAALDQLTINSMLDEKLLIFDANKKLIYSSLDDVSISYSQDILTSLSDQNTWIEGKDGLYDVVGIYFHSRGMSYYGMSKAFDEFGYSKLSFLRYSLIAIFIAFSALVLLLSNYLSNIISKPIAELANMLGNYTIGKEPENDKIATTTFEINYLRDKFSELAARTNRAYLFQKNSIQHISHQLKTPIAVLISELERLRQSGKAHDLQFELDNLLSKTKSLADLINILLEISKIESGYSLKTQAIRVDELVFDAINQIHTLHPDFVFEVNYLPDTPEGNKLLIQANEMLLLQAFQNLLNNCIAYSDNNRAEVRFNCTHPSYLHILFCNSGPVLAENEVGFLFDYFFRGSNSQSRIGFGLGLTLSKSIIELHNGHISYHSSSGDTNIFEVQLPYGLR